MADSKYRSEKLSQLEEGRSYPLTLTSGQAWENETNGRIWWKWMAELPASNPNKQGQYKSEYVYLTHGDADLQKQLEALVEQNGVQDGNRTKTSIMVVKNGKDFKASAGGAPASSGGSGGGGGGGGGQLPGAADAGSVKNTADLLAVLYAYFMDVGKDLNTPMDAVAAMNAAKFAAMDAIKGGVVKDTIELFGKLVTVNPLSRTDLEAGNGEAASDDAGAQEAEAEDGDDLPF